MTAGAAAHRECPPRYSGTICVRTGHFRVTGWAYCGEHGAIQASDQGATMSDKSPRQGMTKKSGKSIKQKRADKRAKGVADTLSDKLEARKR